MKLLLVEDDTRAAHFVMQGLGEMGHSCDLAADGVDGLSAGLSGVHDAIIMDRNLPRMDGLAVLAAMRSQGVMTPVLILSALSGVDERIRGLKAGGDDYLAKPFAFGELIARLEAITRRNDARQAATSQLTAGPLTLDLLSRTATRGARYIDLLKKEFQILDYLMRHAGQVVTRTMLIEAVWDYSFDPGTNVVDVHVSKLRSKIDAPGEAPLIQTVRGSGYMLKA